MKQRNKKILSLMLSMALAASLPASAFAAEDVGDVVGEEVQITDEEQLNYLAPPATEKQGLEEKSGWSYAEGWEWQYDGKDASGVAQENGMVKVAVDYSKNADKDYSKMAFFCYPDGGLKYEGTTKVTFDFYYDETNMTAGSFAMEINSGDDVLHVDTTGIPLDKAETVEGTLKKVPVTFACEAANGSMDGISFSLIGKNTDYKGELWLDNIQFESEPQTPAVNASVWDFEDNTTQGWKFDNSWGQDSYHGPVENVCSAENGRLKVQMDYSQDADNGWCQPGISISPEGGVDASGASVMELEMYYMEDTVLKAGASNLSYSDTEDLTGSLAAINGLDCGGLFSGFASKYNERHKDAEQIPDTTEGNIKAAALLSNEAVSGGAVMTLSCHMPNFAYAQEKDASAANTYDRYDYSTADSYNLTGDCMNQILPGGKFNPQFTAFLDLIAEYAKQVDGAVLFRPFHENTGSWFWWGKAFCDAETYKSVFKYTVEYLRDKKDVYNFLYVYGPGSEAATTAEYSERYPGDAYVDMVGFDTYDDKASADGAFFKSFEEVVKITDQFAKEHKKLFAVTETGITNAAMKKTGNERPEWFSDIMDIITKPDYDCAYYMVWSNYDSKSNYYAPFAVSKAEDGTLHGHELTDGFIRFYNDARSIFAADQKATVYGDTKPADLTVSGWGKTGYITAPVAGIRILDETAVAATVSEDVSDAVISVSNGKEEIKLETKSEGKTVIANITKEVLVKLGEAANGRIILSSGTDKLAEITVIFNIPKKEPDPYMVDDFESYYGVDSMLTAAWATNKASGSTIELNLSDKENEAQDGYGMKFSYSEKSGGWAGATITKEVDWSDCNALSFWTVPDGKQQKTVIQIDANKTCYEVYLNLYDVYNARAGKPTQVIIPFEEFCQRDTTGNPKGGFIQDCKSVGSFGLWVNAVDNESFEGDTVSGTIWYDNITAVKTDIKEPSFGEPKIEEEHTHSWNEGVVTKKATCTDKGVKTYTCTGCGEIKTEEIPMTEHSYKQTVTAATASANGEISDKCTVCGDVKNKKVLYAATSVTLKNSKYVYNKKARKPAVTVKDSKGSVISKAYYSVSYKNNKNIGKATVTITLKGNYTGKLTKTFNILPKGTSISKLKASSKGFQASWKKQTTQTSGYELQYSTSKKFTKKTTKLKKVAKKSVSKEITGLKAKKKYYVRIRTYKTVKVNGKSVKMYSSWSKAKKVTTK